MSDASGISHSSVVITGPENLRHSSGDQAGVFSLNSYGPGFYRMTASATDGDNDWNGDRKSSTAVPRTVQVYDDDTNKPNIAFFDRLGDPLLGSVTSESHGLDNVIAWDIQDQSGISSANATLRRDGVVVKSLAVDATGSISLDEFGLGQFELTLTATDGDTDGWVGDSLTEVSRAYLTVTNQAPTVFVGGPYAIDEGDLLGLDATGSDADPGDTETLAYSWDLDGDGVFGDVTSRNPVLTWQELQPFGMADDGTYPVVVRVDDTYGESAFSSALVTVNNAAPSIVSIQAPPTVSENAPVTLTGSFADDGSEDTHTVLVDWGDGSTSEATVDALSRTFTATHTYVDDQPTATSSDDYTVEVTVIDDDGGVSGDELRAASAQTSHIGGIAFPSFSSSLPAGTNGLMLEAETTVSSQQVVTSTEPPQEYLHTHTIDYPPSGPSNLDPVTTDVADAARDHGHAFPGTSQTLEFTGGDLGNFGQESYPMNAVESSVGGTPAEHDHSVTGASFETSTRFTYELDETVIDPSTQSNTSFVRRNGDARFQGINTELTPNAPGKQGTLIVRAPRKTRNFKINFDYEIWYGNGADGMSIGYAPMSETANFGEQGLRGGPGLWIIFDTHQFDASNPRAIEIWSDGRLRQKWLTDNIRGTWTNTDIRVRDVGSKTRVTITHPAVGVWAHDIPRLNPQSDWRFGFGARTGGLHDFHRLGRTTITDYAPEIRTTSSIIKSSTDRYILPKFNANLGNLRSATTTLTLKPGTTELEPATTVPHTHAVDVQVADFSFAAESFSVASASNVHSHEIDFSPLSRVYTNATPEAVRYGELSEVIVPFTGTTTTTDFGHSHNIAAESVQFDATTVFQYDASKTLIRVENALPAVESLSLDSEIDENGVATLTGSFSDLGGNDTHEVIVDWGDGQSETLTIPFGNTSFAAFHHYLDDDPSGTDGDTYNVTVRIKDDDTGEAIVSREIAINNSDPSLTAPVGFTVDEGQLFSLPLTSFTDAGVFDTHSVLVDWGDGQSEQATVIESAGSGLATANHTYADDGSFTLAVTVSDDDTASDSALVPVTVRNLPPEIQSLSGTLSGDEGASLAFSAIATDPGADILTYHWDFGDGQAPVSGVDLTNVEHLYAADGNYTVRLTVADDDGESTINELTVSVSDVAARMLVTGPTATNEGDNYQLTLGEIVDPGNDPIQGIQVDWGDGDVVLYPAPGTGGSSVGHTFADGASVATIQVAIVDQFGDLLPVAALPVEIRNVAPTIQSLTSPINFDEGQLGSFSALASDAGADPLTYSWDFGDGTNVSGLGLTDPTHAYADNGVYNVQLTVADDEGLAVTQEAVVVVNNVAPEVSVAGASTTEEGATYDLNLSNLVDPGADTISEVLVDWGDGIVETFSDLSATSHVYAEGPIAAVIQVTLRDEDGFHEQLENINVSVENVAPVIDSVAGDLVGMEGSTLTFVATASDPAGPFDVLSYSWNWGDGSPASTGIDLTSASHAYADDGAYTAQLTVTDDEGDATTYDFTVDVQNQSPTVSLAGVPEVDEGAPYSFTLGPISDVGDDSVTHFVVDWGDGGEDTYAVGEAPSHVFADDASGNVISVSLIDEDGTHAGAAELLVDIQNLAPRVLSTSYDQYGIEGDEFQYSVVATDPGAGDLPLTYEWDFGDGNTQSGADLSDVTHIFADDGQYLVTFTLRDDDGGNRVGNVLVTVENQAPSVIPSAVAVALEGDLVTLATGAVDDPGSDTIVTWYVDWGDGSLEEFSFGDAIEHVYVDGDAEYQIELHAEDEDGFHSSVGSTSIGIENVAPALTLLNDASLIIPVGGVADLVGTFSDPGVEDTHSIEIDWGNTSTTSIPTAFSGELVEASQVYEDSGVFTASIAVTDSDGATAVEQVVVDVRPQVTLTRLANGYETGTRSAEFAASIPRALDDDIVLSYALGGTATLGVDYSSPSNLELTIPAGETTAVLTLPVMNDAEVEDLESIVVTVTGFQSVPQGVTLSSTNSAIAILWDNDPDLDLDGISAATEDRAANGGDGNLDGIPDRDQSHVASLPNAVDSQVVTLVGPDGTQLQNVFAHNAIPADSPADVDFPWGMLEFELTGVAVGGATVVDIILPVQAAPTAFFKYGPTIDNPEAHWYDFHYDADSGTGAEFNGNTMTLHFVDGGRGDNDLLANGLITDPGAVAIAVSVSSQISAGGPYVVSQGSVVELAPTYQVASTGPFSAWEWDTDYDGQTFEADLSGASPTLNTSTAGSRTIAVRATDANGVSHLGTGSLTVLNLPPVARADFGSSSENEPVEIDLLANDSDLGQDALSVVANSLQLISATTNDAAIALSTAMWQVDEGVFTFDPGNDFDFLSAVQSATLQFEYSVQDNASVPLADTAFLTVTIQGENDTPLMSVGNPIIVDDATSFQHIRVGDFVGETAIVGSPSLVSDPDEGDSAGIMVHAVSGLDSLSVSLDEGESFEAVDLASLSIHSAMLVPSHAILAVEFSAVGLGELSYLPWDESFGGILQVVDAGLLQNVGQLQAESAVLKLVAAQSVFPTSVDEGIDFSATMDVSPQSLSDLSFYEVQWTDTDATNVPAGETLHFQYPDGPQSLEAAPSIIDAYGVAWALDPIPIAVNNLPPTPSIDTISEPWLEGTEIQVLASASDPAGPSDILTYHYSVTKEGAAYAEDSGVDLTTFDFTPDDNGVYEIQLTVADDDGATTTVSQTIAVENVAPENLSLTSSATFDNRASLTGDLMVTNLGETTASYQSSYGYYLMDDNDLPTSGEIIWANVQVSAGESFILPGVDPDHVGFFIIPDGLGLNPTLNDHTTVTFARNEADDWQASTVDGQAILGQGAHVYFDQRSLNADRKDHVEDDDTLPGWGWLFGGNRTDSVIGEQYWEDQFRLGDRDYNDVRVNVAHTANVTVSGTFADVGSADEHAVQIDWGDGSHTELALDDSAIDQDTNSFAWTHHYQTGGVYQVMVTVTDDDGESVSETTKAVVSGLRLTPNGTLQIVGTAGEDTVDAKVQSSGWSWGWNNPPVSEELVVSMDLDGSDEVTHEFALEDVTRLAFYMGEGDDRVDVKQSVDLETVIKGEAGDDLLRGGDGADAIFGGSGDDRIYANGGDDYVAAGSGNDQVWGDAGNDILRGGSGDDFLQGGNGLDLLAGGSDIDKLLGGRDDDIVIGGALSLSKSAAQDVHARWLEQTAWEDRVAAVTAVDRLEAGVTVTTDTARDELTGNNGRDLFFAQLAGAEADQLKGKKNNELVVEL